MLAAQCAAVCLGDVGAASGTNRAQLLQSETFGQAILVATNTAKFQHDNDMAAQTWGLPEKSGEFLSNEKNQMESESESEKYHLRKMRIAKISKLASSNVSNGNQAKSIKRYEGKTIVRPTGCYARKRPC